MALGGGPGSKFRASARLQTAFFEHTLSTAAPIVRAILAEAAGTLASLAQHATTPAETTAFEDAAIALASRGDILTDSAREEIATTIRSYTPTPTGLVRSDSHATATPRTQKLGLVDDTELELGILARNLAQAARDADEEEWTMLTARVGLLVGDASLELERSPIRPATLIDALRAAMKRDGQSAQQQILVLRESERIIAKALRDWAIALNDWLAREGVTPESDVPYVRRARDTGRSSTLATTGSTPATPAAPPATAAPRAANVVPPVGVGWEAPSRATVRDYVNTLQGAEPSPAIASNTVTRAHTGFLQHLAQLDIPMPVWSAPHTMTADTPVNFGGGLLWQLRNSPEAQELRDVDAFSIDVLAMLFDFVFDDPDIPLATKVLIGRLQIPVLRLTMNDRQFFSNKQHPARQLLDRLAALGLMLHASATTDEPPLSDARDAIDEVCRESAPQTEQFAQALLAVNAIIEGVEQDTQAFVEESVNLAAERDAAGQQQVKAEHVIDEVAQNALLPGAVREVLEDVWPLVLARAYTNDGEGGTAWKEALACVQDLVWSLQPKHDLDERNRLVSTVPKLVERLERGFASIGVPREQTDRFFSALVDCHARAMMAPETTSTPGYAEWISDADAAGRTQRATIPDVRRNRVADRGIRIEELKLSYHGRVTPPASVPATPIDAALPAIGDWVEFADESESQRLRLTWASPTGATLLFTNPLLAHAISVSRDLLAAQIAAGEVRVLESGTAVERAVQGVVGVLNAPAREPVI